jgi:hypothetical protein
MAEVLFWVGVPGEFTAEQATALTSDGLDVDDLRRSQGGRGDEWRTLRTFLRVPAEQKPDAVARVAAILDIDARKLSVHPEWVFAS